MPMRRANADEMLERIVRAVRRAGSQAQKVPCARGGHRRNACVRRLRVDGQVHALHVLTNVHARRNRRAKYTQMTLERKALAKVAMWERAVVSGHDRAHGRKAWPGRLYLFSLRHMPKRARASHAAARAGGPWTAGKPT